MIHIFSKNRAALVYVAALMMKRAKQSIDLAVTVFKKIKRSKAD